MERESSPRKYRVIRLHGNLYLGMASVLNGSVKPSEVEVLASLLARGSVTKCIVRGPDGIKGLWRGTGGSSRSLR